MKQYFGLGVGLLAGTLIGAVAVSGLRAQGKPPVYLITEIDVSDPEAYSKEFAPIAQEISTAAGAELIAIGGIGGEGATPITAFEGTPPKRITVHEWNSLDDIKAWYNSAVYQEALKIGRKYATFRRYAVEGQ